jgi:glucose-1-phosphate cytidylyltransferase
VKAGLWINGGFFVFRQEILRNMRDGEELVEQSFQRLIQEGQLIGYKYNGYWSCMDTLKDEQQLDDLNNQGNAPWEVWKSAENGDVESSLGQRKATKRR